MALPISYTSLQQSDDFGLTFSNLLYSATLATNTDTSFTVPGNAPRYKAIMKASSSGNVYVALNAAAVTPAGASIAAVSSELITVNNHLCREVKAGDVLHFKTAGSSVDISIVLYAVVN